MVTGESIPVEKLVGDEVIGGTLNKTGSFRFRATKVGKDTALANIIRMVKDAQGSKAPIQRVVDTVSGYFVPSVMILAVLAFVAWYDFGPEPRLIFSTIVFVTTLIIACPCALGLATPTSLTVGIGKGAENGILIRSGDALQAAENLDAIILDKTGTITRGEPALTDVVVAQGQAENEVLRLAASLERGSEHPLGEAIVKGAEARSIELAEAENFAAVPGHGVIGRIDGHEVLLGNVKLMRDRGVAAQELDADWERLANEGKTPMYVAIDGKPAGLVAVADTVKPDSKAAIDALKALGIEVVMLTGDNELTGRAIAHQVGIERVLSEVLPDQKAHEVQKLQLEGKAVGMVGDGVNDAPALAQADVGFAIGTGTDVAIEASDVTLIKGSLLGVVTAIEISRATMRNVRQNLVGAFGYNVLGIPVAMGVLYPFIGLLLSPLIAAAAMAFSSVTVVTNANRLRLFDAKEDRLMSPDRLSVTIAGVLLIAFIVWFFWFKRSKGTRAAETSGGYQEAMILVKGGYTPDTIIVRAGRPVRLNFRREETATCSDKVIFADFQKSAELPTGETVPVELMPKEPGEFSFRLSHGNVSRKAHC